MSFTAPQLLTAARSAPEGDGWLHEVKYDGYRLLAHVGAGGVRLYTRNGNDWTARLRRVADEVAGLGIRRGYLDGELVAVGGYGFPDFHALHRAMRGCRSAPPLVYQVFDVLHAGGRELLEVDVALRKEIVRELVAGRSERVRYTDHAVGSGPALHAQAHALGVEGIVCKRIGSGYHPGRRVRWWLKVKCFHRYTFTVRRTVPEGVQVVDGDGRSAGTVPVWSARVLAALRPGARVEVKALAWTPGRKLRHATLCGTDGPAP